MRKPQNLLTTEELFLYLLGRNLAEPKRLSANISRSGKGQPFPHSPGVVEANLYLVYESPIFARSPIGSAEVMAVQFPGVPEDRVRRILEDALWRARSDHGTEEQPADLSAAVMASAEINAFRLLLELPSVCLRRHDGVLDSARNCGLLDFAIPSASAPEESATLPANSTGLTRQVVERLASEMSAPECEMQWDQAMGSAPGMA